MKADESVTELGAGSQLYRAGRRVVSGAVLLAPSGRVLLQHRDDKPEIDSPGKWSLFGGGVDVGESPEAAMIREIEEEIAYRVKRFRPLIVFTGNRTEFHVYLSEITASIDELTLLEGQGFAFFEPQEALKLELSEVARLSLAAYGALESEAKGLGDQTTYFAPS